MHFIKIISTIRLLLSVTTQYCWLYSPCVHSLLLGLAGTLYLLMVFTYFIHAPTNPTFWQGAICSLYLWVFLFCFVCFNSTEIMHYLFFSVWLILVSIPLSRSIHVTSDSKILFFFHRWVIVHHMCVSVCIPHLLNLFICW